MIRPDCVDSALSPGAASGSAVEPASIGVEVDVVLSLHATAMTHAPLTHEPTRTRTSQGAPDDIAER
jgi:hypothetical protein